MQFSSTMCSNKIEYEETRIAIRRFLPTRYTFGFVALDSAMINAILPHYTYDNAGNLVEEQNPLGEIFYDYTYYRVLNKRYSNMTGNNVTYTYGTSGTERGRPIHITDGSGMYECQYDSLGNVTEETRTIALPNHNEVYRFRTSYQYDSWGRMLSMTYPDGEEVAYTYLWGGDLYSMHGTKGANHRVYVSKILYNTFGQRSQVEYGNQTKAYYTYDALHRLVNLKSRNGSGTLMQDISYTFDSASNVTGITNTAGIVNSLGGGYANSYRYDALHRLVWSSGGGAMGSYSMDMGYTPSGRIGEKNRLTHLGTFSETVETIYGYCDTYQPHAVRRIYDRAKGIHHDLRWDGAGNLGQISVANEEALFESGRFLFWTEDSRMHAAVDEKYYSYYTYDHGGERRLKLTGENHLVDVNANYMSTYSALSRPTLYPSAYMVVNSKGYTKHYYAGAERVAARIGGGGLDALISLADGGDSLRTKASHLFTQSIGQVNNRVLEKNEPDCITGSVAEQDELKVWIEGIPEQLQASTLIDYGEFTDAVQSLRADHNGGQEREVYFYHSDHLGSASWITDSGGQAIQHLQYLPYGEPYINQRTSGYSERFTFTGKERDEETGYGYFGARYMDHELMTMWLSVDPLADKYPNISPYHYCAWNPVKLVDVDGLYPRAILKYDAQAFPHGGGYWLTPSAVHLLSLVSGVKESYIANSIIVKRGFGHYVPWYSSKKGGGGITLGHNSYCSNIILTENYFEDDASAYNNHGYGQNISEWLDILSHEVGHIPQIDKNGGMTRYVLNAMVEYLQSAGHDTAPSEIEADIGQNQYRKFCAFVSQKYGEEAIPELFSSHISDKRKIQTIDKWWNEYNNSCNEAE